MTELKVKPYPTVQQALSRTFSGDTNVLHLLSNTGATSYKALDTQQCD